MSRALYRKYRSTSLAEVVGQDHITDILTRALKAGRIAHAYLLTGPRGVGKTSIARILAHEINQLPYNEDTSHLDIIEIDAASNNGVEDVRDLREKVQLAPVSASKKVYIIDEVHMLSKNAFNALLKTLEEPPPHVKFIFATTEIRKVPVTVLSRCQRFDLRRIDAETLSAYYKTICEKEGVQADDEALTLIARAADGSARDGLSMLDQSIALSQGHVTAQSVKDMLGLADRSLVLDLFEKSVTGQCEAALEIMDDLYRKGADPSVIIGDLLDLSHLLTKLRAVPSMKDTMQVMAREEMDRAALLATKLSMPALGRTWQVLLKGLNEVNYAPVPQKAAEMVLIRLAYASELPDPADLIKKIQSGQVVAAPSSPMPPSGGGAHQQTVMTAGVSHGGGPSAAIAVQPETAAMAVPVPTAITTLEDVVAVIRPVDVSVSTQVYLNVHLVKLEEGRIEFRPNALANPELAQELTRALKTATGKRWMVTISDKPGMPTLAEAKEIARKEKFTMVRADKLVAQVIELFPDAELTAIHSAEDIKEQ